MAYLSRMRRIWLLCLAAAVACALPACSSGSPPAPGLASPARHGHHGHDTAPRVHVSGNRLVNSHGRPVVLHGVNRSGAEFVCVQGNGIFDGPSDAASVQAIAGLGHQRRCGCR